MSPPLTARMRVLVLFAAAAAACAGLLLRPALLTVDIAAAAWAANHRGMLPVLAEAVSDATPSVGGGLALAVLAVITACWSGRHGPLLRAGWALVLTGIVVAAGKLLLAQGPSDDGVGLPGPRYPSGPVTTAIVVGGTGVLLLADVLPPVLRRVGYAVTCAVAGSIGAAEVYLGQHRLSDVLASGLLGVALLILVVTLGRPRTVLPCRLRQTGDVVRRWPGSPPAGPRAVGSRVTTPIHR